MRIANTALRKWFRIGKNSGRRDRLAFRCRTPRTGEIASGPFQGVRLHRIDVVALKAGHIRATGSVGHRDQSSFANRASTQIHQHLHCGGDRQYPAQSHNRSGRRCRNLYLPAIVFVSYDTLFEVRESALSEPLSILVRKLEEHSRLSPDDRDTIASLNHVVRKLESNEDLIRQGDDPSVSALVTSGVLARYHLLGSGRRQYLSYHLTGDMPDSQALFIEEMDHSVCAIGPAAVALIPHKELLAAFKRRPSIAFAIWRETLVDAAIFREAITNNSARTGRARMAHFFCELFYRAKASGLTEESKMMAPISLIQLGETLAMSIATVNRTLSDLRKSRTVDFQRGVLQIKNWERLAKLAQFNPSYLHLKKAPI
jgi:CRP-like cAMP-binding protein